MFGLPPLPPSWDAWHPVLVHFPLGLLMVAPLMIVLGLVLRGHERGLNIAAFVVLLLGTVFAFLAVSSGEAAGDLVPETGAVGAVLERHEEAAETARTIFALVTGFFGVVVFGPMLLKKPVPRRFTAAGAIVLLIACGAGCLALANAGHLGGELVHVHGVRARLAAGAVHPAPDRAAPEQTQRGEREED